MLRRNKTRPHQTSKAKLKGAKLNQCFIFSIMLFVCAISAYSQGGAIGRIEAEQIKIRPAYLNISFGVNRSSFRDFATSPLVYSGNPLYVSLSHIDIDERRESHLALSYAFGKYKTNFNKHTAESEVNTVALNYLELFQLKKWSNARFGLKIGGQFNSTVNLRANTALFNNREGVDVISTLFGSAKATLGLNRKVQSNKNPLLTGNRNDKRIQSLSYTVNVGMANSSYRNRFAYTSPSAPLNEDDFFAGYEFQIFKGFRLNSTLDYTVFLHNKNALQFSYIWDAYRTSGHHDNFEMTAHILKLSLLFGLK